MDKNIVSDKEHRRNLRRIADAIRASDIRASKEKSRFVAAALGN
jgi:hypothetical protein